jgi:hypothetical protein
MSSSEARESLRQSWRELCSCGKQVCANEAKRYWDALCVLAVVALACVATLMVCYVMVWFAWDVADLHGLIKIPPLSGVQCLDLALVWAIVTIAALAAIFTFDMYTTYGHQDTGSDEVWINYDDAVGAIEEALPQLGVSGPTDEYAQQMLVALLDGPRGATDEIRYLDAMFLIADCLRNLGVPTFGHDYEEVAERILAPQPHGCMAR